MKGTKKTTKTPNKTRYFKALIFINICVIKIGACRVLNLRQKNKS